MMYVLSTKDTFYSEKLGILKGMKNAIFIPIFLTLKF